MKISEMTNDQASEAMIRISTPISNICDDEEATGLIEELTKAGDMSVIDVIAKTIPKVVTFAFKKHRADLYEIVGALTMQSATAVGKMNFKDTIQTVKDSYDDILSGFFTQSKAVQRKKGG